MAAGSLVVSFLCFCRRVSRRSLLVAAAAFAAGIPLESVQAQTPTPVYPTGAIPSSPRDFARASRFVIRAKRGDVRPARVMLTEFLPPAKSQGKQNSCVGWSTAYYAYTYAVAQKRLLSSSDRKSDKFQFSPAFVYHLGNNGSDKGMPIPIAMGILKEKGCCTLAEMPYNDKDFSSAPDEETLKRAQRYVAIDFASITRGPSVEAAEKWKTLLADTQQPFVIGIDVYKTFYTPDRKKPYDAPSSGEPLGKHAVTVIGYDDEKHAFRIINSWGEAWGDKGQLWLSEDFLAKHAYEAWGFIPGGPATRFLDRSKPQLPASISIVPPAAP